MALDPRKQRIDILHVIGALAAGGAERFVIDLLIQLKALGLKVGLLTLSPRRDPATANMHQCLETAGIPYAQGPTERVRFRSVIWYYRQLHAIDPQIVHLHTENTELVHFLANRISRIRADVFRTIHNTKIHSTFLNLLAMRNNSARLSISCSDAVHRQFHDRLQGEIVTVQNGIRFDWPIQDPESKRAARERLSLADDIHHFVQVGRLNGDTPETSQKAVDILLQAWKRSGIGARGALLHLLGDGNLRGRFEALAGEDRSIRFHGISDRVHDWLLAADWFVMPSRHEGLPIAGIEAVGSGLPCLFTDIAPLRELTPPVALWSDVGDIGQLAENLRSAMDLDSSIPATATRQIRERFGIQGTANHYRKCYLEAVPPP